MRGVPALSPRLTDLERRLMELGVTTMPEESDERVVGMEGIGAVS